jgi:hypothetical protein
MTRPPNARPSEGGPWKRLLGTISLPGDNSGDGTRRLFLALAMLLALAVLLPYGIIELSTGQLRNGVVDSTAAAATAVLLALLLFTRLSRTLLHTGAALIAAVMLYYVWAPQGGGYSVLWAFTYPVGVLFALGRKWGLRWCAGFLVAFTLLVVAGWHAGGNAYGTDAIDLPVALLVVSVMAYALEFLRERHYAEHIRERERLQKALAEVKELSGLLPICARCKRIRDDKGYWSQVEEYIARRTDARFTHSVCPDCGQKIYGEMWHRTDKPHET